MIELIIGIIALALLVQQRAFWKFMGFCLCVIDLFFMWQAYARGDWSIILFAVSGAIIVVSTLWGVVNGLIWLCDWILVKLDRYDREKWLKIN